MKVTTQESQAEQARGLAAKTQDQRMVTEVVTGTGMSPWEARVVIEAILRADELPGLIGRCRYPGESQSLREEQATIGQSVVPRIRRSQLDGGLRQVNPVIGEQPRTAIEAAMANLA